MQTHRLDTVCVTKFVSIYYTTKNTSLLDAAVAMDLAVLQKILPRIHGSSQSIKKSVCLLYLKSVLLTSRN